MVKNKQGSRNRDAQSFTVKVNADTLPAGVVTEGHNKRGCSYSPFYDPNQLFFTGRFLFR